MRIGGEPPSDGVWSAMLQGFPAAQQSCHEISLRRAEIMGNEISLGPIALPRKSTGKFDGGY
jgi:hypothetical protein